MTKQQCQTCMEWFEDSELDTHLNEHMVGHEEKITRQRLGRRGEFLGAFSSIGGLITTFLVALLIGFGESIRRDPPYGVPLSVSLLVLFSFCGSLLGFVGAWEARGHRKVGGLSLLFGGMLSLGSYVSYLALVPASEDYSLLRGFIFLQWWSPLLVLAGMRTLSDLPRPALRQN